MSKPSVSGALETLKDQTRSVEVLLDLIAKARDDIDREDMRLPHLKSITEAGTHVQNLMLGRPVTKGRP